ncbi:MAG: chloramphenicol phosphotransferase [Hyphomicrobiaceae bacterium]
MAAKSRIVLLNGVGSAGKSSIAKALQTMTRSPFLHVAMDVFLEMLPEAYQNHPESFRYEARLEDGKPSIAIHHGPIGGRLMAGLRAAVAGLATEGNNLIVDDVIFGDDGSVADYRIRLAGHDLMLVGVHAPLAVLDAREKARGDRQIGLARWQFPRVHSGLTYDLEVDTARNSPETCARRIRDRFDL